MADEKKNTNKTVYVQADALAEMREEAARLDRSVAFIVGRAWAIAKSEIKKMPSVDPVE